jgi:hypothetical protein
MHLKDDVYYSCLLKDKGGQTLYFFLRDNEMDLKIVPAYLLALTQIKEIVIAQSYV